MTTGCRCFDVCSPAGLASTLLRLPQQVSSRESPWHGYLSDVYHGALPPLPFALRGHQLRRPNTQFINVEHFRVNFTWEMVRLGD